MLDEAADKYIEDLGASPDALGYGHLVVVNDTRVTLNDAYSLHPAIAIDNSGNTHVTWMDGRAYGFDIDVNYEIYYTRLRLSSAGAWDGVSEGLPSYAIKQISDDARGPDLNLFVFIPSCTKFIKSVSSLTIILL